MLILALDTCDARGSVAVLRDETLLACQRHDDAEDYAAWLLPAVQRVLAESSVRLSDVDVFAAAAGPGSFTGLRVGLASVKAWAEAYGRPVAPVSRLEALAHQVGESSGLVAPFVDARREQVFGGLYRRTGEDLRLVGQEAVISPAAFIDLVSREAGAQRVVWPSLDPGCLTKEAAWASRAASGDAIVTVEPAVAVAIGRLAFRRARDGRLSDALTLDANYVRRSDAEIFWKGGPAHGR